MLNKKWLRKKDIPNHIWKDVRVTIWKGNGLEDTKHS